MHLWLDVFNWLIKTKQRSVLFLIKLFFSVLVPDSRLYRTVFGFYKTSVIFKVDKYCYIFFYYYVWWKPINQSENKTRPSSRLSVIISLIRFFEGEHISEQSLTEDSKAAEKNHSWRWTKGLIKRAVLIDLQSISSGMIPVVLKVRWGRKDKSAMSPPNSKLDKELLI